jgi:SpoVK/Ycf46/Vps4 family AAA+-type ATPase
MEQNIWIQDGNTFIKGSATTKAHPEGLPKGIYEVKESMTGYYLNRLGDSFVFNYKLYGINSEFIDHFVKTYNNTTGNLGVLFNGIKGTGKTVTAEELCNRIGLPVIIVKSCKEVDDMLKFLATQINFDCIFFFDEYEKEFRESSSVLSFMDGVHNSQYRKIFLLTTNELEINNNLLGRPSRIRYVRSFGNLPEETTLELLNDILIDKDAIEPVLDLIRQMQIVTVDLVKALAQEVNIHGVDKIDLIRKNFNLEFSDFTYLVESIESGSLSNVQNINEQLFEKIIRSREVTRKIERKSPSKLTEEERDAQITMAGTYIRTDSVSVNKEIKYLKIGDEFDDRPIFYINAKKGYIVTCYNHFIIYILNLGILRMLQVSLIRYIK